MTRRTLKLATLMLGLNLGALAVVSVVLFVGTYLTAQRAVDMAMERTFAQRHKVAELLIRDCLNLIAGEVSVLAGQQATIEAVARRDKAVLERSLSSLYEHESDCHIDILFVADAQGRPWVDVSAARVSTQTIPARFVGTGQAEEAWRLVEGSGPGDPTAAFVTSRPVVSDWDGGLVGEVYAGILFNNNLALTRAIRRASGADTIGIVYRGQVIADSERRSSEALEVMRRTALDHPHGTISRSGDLLLAGRPLDVAGAGPALSIVQSFPNEAFAALRADYRNTAVVLVLAVLTAALLVVLVMRRATLPALGRLVAYANSVQS
ncbi:MAG: hypothetical protein KDE22_07390, partial [Rhodobacterales bacterium]|nr:hypothetical protein [Rhodobacterales bacterium]